MSNFTIKGKVWKTSEKPGDDIYFPENCYKEYYHNVKGKKISIGLAYSGGGSRSYNACIGYLRSLRRFGVYDLTNYVSTASGGSWTHGIYSFAKSMNKYTDNDLLGIYIPPQRMTIENLKRINFTKKYEENLFMGARSANADVVYYTIQALAPFNGIPLDEWYPYVIEKIFLDPYNIGNHKPITLNKETAMMLNLQNNTNIDFLYLQDKDPFWICNTTMEFSGKSLYKNETFRYPYLVVPMTPLYSGVLQKVTLKDSTEIGGFVGETFTFDSNCDGELPRETYNNTDSETNNYIKMCRSSKYLNFTDSPNRMSLSEVIGASSAGHSFGITQIVKKLGFTSIQNFIPKFKFWTENNLLKTTSDSQCSIGLTGNCNTLSGYDPESCIRYGIKCYSKSAPQCLLNRDCSYSFRSGECINIRGGSSLNCRNDGLGWSGIRCKCTNQNHYQRNLINNDISLGDGNSSDNTGIISLLSRNVDRIIAFNNSSFPLLDENGNIARDSKGIELCDRQIRNLFGVGIDDCDPTVLAGNNIKVFNTEDFNLFLSDFRRSLLSGGPIFARRKIRVLPNKLYGIKGNYEVDLLIVMLGRCKRFIDALPQETRIKILNNEDDFKNFPYYSTILNDFRQGLIQYSPTQVNLLHSFADWSLQQEELKNNIMDMYNLS